MAAKDILASLDSKYPGLWGRLEALITGESYFQVFKALSDNYSPTLTVSRVQGPRVVELLDEPGKGNASPVHVSPNLRGSGTIGITIGSEPAPAWFSGHADICSYLTGRRNGDRYDLTPFCMHRAAPGRRAAAALSAPGAPGPLARLAQGEMITDEEGRVFFETDDPDLPLWTRVVHDLPATWDQETGAFHGFLDNQASCAALLLVARLLSHYEVNALLLLNDEEEGPVDKGNQTFSRALGRLLHRTSHDRLPAVVFVSDMHQQESRINAGETPLFGEGALYAGMASGARGAVTPPQLLAFTRELAGELAPYGIRLTENGGYVSRSDDVSAMRYTQNVNIIGFAGVYPHFDRTPTAYVSDLVQMARALAIYALIAQDPEWRRAYL